MNKTKFYHISVFLKLLIMNVKLLIILMKNSNRYTALILSITQNTFCRFSALKVFSSTFCKTLNETMVVEPFPPVRNTTLNFTRAELHLSLHMYNNRIKKNYNYNFRQVKYCYV